MQGSCPKVGPQMVALQATDGRRPSTGFGFETTFRLGLSNQRQNCTHNLGTIVSDLEAEMGDICMRRWFHSTVLHRIPFRKKSNAYILCFV